MASNSALRKRDFQQKRNITDPPTLSPILDVAVPRSQAWLLPHNRPFELLIATEETQEAEANGEYTFQLTQDTMGLPHLRDSATVCVYDTVQKKHLTVTAFDAETNKIMVSDAVSGNTCKLFYPMKTGIVQIAIQAPMGMGGLRLPLFNRAINTVHAVDQYLSTSPLQLRESPAGAGGRFGGWIIPETYRLQVMVKSTVQVTTDENARNYHIYLPYRFDSVGNMPRGYEEAVRQVMLTGGR